VHTTPSPLHCSVHADNLQDVWWLQNFIMTYHMRQERITLPLHFSGSWRWIKRECLQQFCKNMLYPSLQVFKTLFSCTISIYPLQSMSRPVCLFLTNSQLNVWTWNNHYVMHSQYNDVNKGKSVLVTGKQHISLTMTLLGPRHRNSNGTWQRMLKWSLP
jgi:hypothetical protein